MSKVKNPLAFPHPSGAQDCEGMTLRDWFAGQTLAGMLAHPDADYAPFGHPSSGRDGVSDLAREAYRLSDAMLAERAKGGDA